MARTLYRFLEKRAWVRTATHTVVRDDDPDFQRFAASGEGFVRRVVRVWIADPCGGSDVRTYLGSITLSSSCPSLRELRRVFRRAEQETSGAERPAVVRAELARILRRRLGWGAEASPAR